MKLISLLIFQTRIVFCILVHCAFTPQLQAQSPDLIVESVSWTPSAPVVGSAITFSAVIRNTGTSATPGFRTDDYDTGHYLPLEPYLKAQKAKKTN